MDRVAKTANHLAFGSEDTVFLPPHEIYKCLTDNEKNAVDGEKTVEEEIKEIFETNSWHDPRFKESFDVIGIYINDMASLGLKDPDGKIYPVGLETARHSLRTFKIATRHAEIYAENESIDPIFIDLVGAGAISHDAGKLREGIINPKLIDNRYRYTKEQDRIDMARHPQSGFEDLYVFGEQIGIDLLPEATIALLHHVPKRAEGGGPNAMSQLTPEHWDVLREVHSIYPKLKPKLMLEAVFGVALADLWDAIRRPYVPREDLLVVTNKVAAMRWLINNIDGTRLGLSIHEVRRQTRAFITVIEEMEGLVDDKAPPIHEDKVDLRTEHFNKRPAKRTLIGQVAGRLAKW